MSYSIAVRTLSPQSVLVMRRRVKRSEVAKALGELLGAVFLHVQRCGAVLAGQPFTRYLEWGPGMLSIEAGLPIAAPVPGEGPVLAETLPGGSAAVTTHAGGYEGLSDAHAAVQAWIEANEDAARAASDGIQAVVVSNHGGRQLDGTAASIEALPEVVAAVGDQCEVYLDSGIRRGTDVLKSLALGARAVLVGRPVLWGLAVDGMQGAADVLQMLRNELAQAMALSGRPDIASIDRQLVR